MLTWLLTTLLALMVFNKAHVMLLKVDMCLKVNNNRVMLAKRSIFAIIILTYATKRLISLFIVNVSIGYERLRKVNIGHQWLLIPKGY